jgi:polyisoprenoid-binding protein YceI
MSTTTEIRHSLPTGTWQLDPVHSSIGFEIEYMGGVFRGQFRDVEATLVVGGDAASLTGAAKVASVDVKDENLAAHLASPEFFDVERYPELRFVATDVTGGGKDLAVRGEIAIKGVTQPVELTGRATAPLTDAYGRERLGVTLSTKLDRTAFGLSWNLPLPSGEPALSDEVTLVAELYFVQEA